MSSSELSPYHLAGSGQGARSLVVLAIGHALKLQIQWEVDRDTLEILFNYNRAKCCGREAWESLTRGTNLILVAREGQGQGEQ